MNRSLGFLSAETDALYVHLYHIQTNTWRAAMERCLLYDQFSSSCVIFAQSLSLLSLYVQPCLPYIDMSISASEEEEEVERSGDAGDTSRV